MDVFWNRKFKTLKQKVQTLWENLQQTKKQTNLVNHKNMYNTRD